MLNKFVKEYLSFTRKERSAVIVLACLISVILLLPYLVPTKQDKIDQAALKDFELQLARLKPLPIDSSWRSREEENNPDFVSDNHEEKGSPSSNPKLFYFDPNTLSVDGWLRLGIPEKTARTIHKYLSKGGKFKQAEDIGKIYGLRDEQVRRLLPFARVKNGPDEGYSSTGTKSFNKAAEPFRSHPSGLPYPRKTVDLNTGDTSAFIALPGIGSKLAARIVSFRSNLGGFYSVEQLAEVYGLPDSTFRKIRQSITIAANGVTRLNINKATANELKQHPYLRQNLARAIVAYRLQHGEFSAVEDIRKIDVVTPELFEKVSPYLTVE